MLLSLFCEVSLRRPLTNRFTADFWRRNVHHNSMQYITILPSKDNANSSKEREYITVVNIWGLGTTYDVHLGLIGKRVVDFLLMLIELFLLGVTAESLRAKTDRKSAISLQRGHFDPKFQVEGVVPHQ